MKIKMAQSLIFILFIILFLISTTPASAQIKRAPVLEKKPASKDTPTRQAPPIKTAPSVDKLMKLPDLTVTTMNVRLESTDASRGNEFPTDKVRIEATIKNAGKGSVQAGASINWNLTRNGSFVAGGTSTDALGAPDSSWVYSYIDSFPHNQSPEYEYKLSVSGNFNEANTGNNKGSFVIKEAALHSGGVPDFIVSVSCKRGEFDSSGIRDFTFRADVRNIGTGYAQHASAIKILRADDDKLLGMITFDSSNLPSPGYDKPFYVTLKSNKIPSGKYNVIAMVDPVAGESNTKNNSSSPTEIINQFYSISATPNVAPTGTNVSLKWNCEGVGKIDIYVTGKYKGGSIKGLSDIGSREGMCPYGDTYYRFVNSATGYVLGEVSVKSSVPHTSITNEMLLALNPYLLENIKENLGEKVHVDSLSVEILASGLKIDLKGSYKKEHLEPIDIKVHALVWPEAPQGPIVLDMKEFDVHIGSTATRIAWDILTAGLYEVVLKELDTYFSNKYRDEVKRKLAAQLNSLSLYGANELGFFELHDGVLDIYKCKFCHYPSVTGGL